MADGKKNLGKGTIFNLSTREGKGQVDLEPVLIFFFKETNTTEYTQQNSSYFIKVCTEYNKIYTVLYS